MGAADKISGGDGNDSLFGNGGSDTIYGGEGNDYLQGDAGTDVLSAQLGYDKMRGGADADTFLYDQSGFQQDTIWDFVHNVDNILFHRSIFANFAAVQAGISQVGNHTYINGGFGDLIVLANFNAATLTSADFTFLREVTKR